MGILKASDAFCSLCIVPAVLKAAKATTSICIQILYEFVY